jgi:Cu2+-containing amine oxidase
MKTKIIITVLFLTAVAISQNIYDVIPGTKGNEIKLTVANVSESDAAQDVNVTLQKKSYSVKFNNETEVLELIEPNKEELITFTFDINRNSPVNKKDTIEFMITDLNGISLLKSFIFNYTAPKEFKLEQNYPNLVESGRLSGV